MSDFKPTAKTVVTEIRHFIVDAVRKIGAGRQSVAALITQNTLNQTDVVVGPGNPYVFKDVRQVFSISTPSPVILELTAFGTIPDLEPRTDQNFNNAKVSVTPILAGSFINVRVEDADTFGPSVKVEAFNTRTGETEYIDCACTAQGVFQGFITSLNTQDTGLNFDNSMYCSEGDVIRFSYLEAYNAQGLSENISVEASVTSPIKATELFYNASVIVGQALKFAVYNGGTEVQRVRVTNLRTGTIRDVVLSFSGDVGIGSLNLGVDDTFDALGVSVDDQLDIVYSDAYDSTGLKTVIHKIATVIAPGTLAGEIVVLPTVKAYSELEIEVRDYDMTASQIVVSVNNARTGVSTPVVLSEVWSGMGIYRGRLQVLPAVGLAGDALNITYADYTNAPQIQTAQTTVISQADSVIPVPETPVDLSVSKPIQITVNGLFFLNGSFAGTLKLIAPDENEVRCAIIKA